MVKVIREADFGQAEECALAVLDFSATWYGPCKMLAPVLEKLSEEMKGKAEFFKVDVDENPEIAGAFQIQSIPTLMMFKDGQPVSKTMGFQPKEALKKFIATAQ